jgi:hypothetical protein
MFNMIIAIWIMLSIAFAEPIAVRVALDDRQYKRVTNPVLNIGTSKGEFSDNGVASADVPNDKIYVSEITVERAETFTISISDSNGSVGTINVSVPSVNQATFQLKVTQDGVVLDLNAPMMPSNPSPQATAASSPMLQAAPRGEEISSNENVLLTMVLDDRFAMELNKPHLHLHDSGTEPLKFSDDGENGDEVKGDNSFFIQMSVPYEKFIQLTLLDGGTEVIIMTVFLPQTKEAVVRIRKDSSGYHMLTKSEVSQKTLTVQAVETTGDNPPKGEIVVLVSLDAIIRKVSKPTLKVMGSKDSLTMLDNGEIEGDTPEDNIYYGRVVIAPTESLMLMVLDGEKSLGLVKVSVPSVTISEIELSYTQYGLSIKGEENSKDNKDSSGNSQLILQAAPEGTEVSSESSDDKIALKIYLDDRTLKRLGTPTLQLNQKGFSPVEFRDNGEDGDEDSGDHLFISKTVIERDEFVQIMIVDGEEKVGQLTIFLPSTSEAVVRVRTSENGIKMMTEPQSGAKTDDGASSSPASSSNTLVHVLWVAIALFALAFAYIRNVVYRYWTDEFKPVLDRLNNFLDQQEKKKDDNDDT